MDRPGEVPALDAAHWFREWEAMMEAYTHRRQERFEWMLRLPELETEAELLVLDLGAGPGSLAFRAAERFPRAQIVAIEFDPVLIAIGRGVAPSNVRFMQADLRAETWARPLAGMVDLILSATALHWLDYVHHRALYRRIFRLLRPGGWFFNADHMGQVQPWARRRDAELVAARQAAIFERGGALRWNELWDAMQRRHPETDLAALRKEDQFWEGSDEGLPVMFHLAALADAGFANAAQHWQDGNDALIGAQRPRPVP